MLPQQLTKSQTQNFVQKNRRRICEIPRPLAPTRCGPVGGPFEACGKMDSNAPESTKKQNCSVCFGGGGWGSAGVSNRGGQRFFFWGVRFPLEHYHFFTCACASSLLFQICQCAMRYSATRYTIIYTVQLVPVNSKIIYFQFWQRFFTMICVITIYVTCYPLTGGRNA